MNHEGEPPQVEKCKTDRKFFGAIIPITQMITSVASDKATRMYHLPSQPMEIVVKTEDIDEQ